MHHSPRTRRLRNDLLALERVRSESSIFRFSAHGDPPTQYAILYRGRGLCRDRGKIRMLDAHRVEIKLGSSYPRTIPELRWVTPIYHPNISEIGMVCLGGYGTHWVPSVQLDELCVMLWDMVRYHNYDIRSPYNREAALWVANQTAFRFPIDERPLRDLRAAQGRIEQAPDSDQDEKAASSRAASGGAGRGSSGSGAQSDSSTPAGRVRHFINQYGQIFAKGRAPLPGDQAGFTVPAGAPPAQDSTEQAGMPLDPGPAPQPADAALLFELGASLQAEPAAEPGRALANGCDDTIIFEPISPGQRAPVAPRGGDEIVFID
jgi:Ubiquitin-conjugating enzyme